MLVAGREEHGLEGCVPVCGPGFFDSFQLWGRNICFKVKKKKKKTAEVKPGLASPEAVAGQLGVGWPWALP